MKKLLITAIAVVSVGLCAKAEDTGFISGTSFDDLQADANFVFDNDYWQTQGDTEDQFKITNVTYSADATNQHWDWTDGEKALSIDTANPILRNVNPKDGETGENTAQDVSPDPVFFDSVVQFTATDVAPSMENNTTDKLAVWLYTSPDDVSDTNLGLFGETSPITRVAITAGYLDGATLKTKNYITNIEVEPDTWHRLTIKSFVKSGRPWYSVWVDKTPVNGKAAIDAEEGLTEFLSMVSDDVNTDTYTKLQGVAFDGKGAVDDIVFTTTDPFYVPPEIPKEFFLNLALSADDAAEAALLLVKVNGETVSKNDAGVYNLALNANNIVAYVECASGYEIQGASYDSDSQCWIVPINVAGATENGTLNVTITVVKAGGSTSVKVGEVEVEFDSTGKITNITTANNGQVVTGEITDDMFADYYAVSVVDGKLVIALDPEVAEPTIGETAADKGDAIVVTETEVALGVTNAKAGLWYGAQAYSDAACTTKIGDEPTGWEKATGETVTVTATKPEGDKAFFKVVVDDQDHTPATPPEEQN